ncbi:hypothetical protein H6F86_31130 [Phormidium sp. FACHB-592]|uniref:Uncharacterized protein n=1 Tax=Stenomitos frigidus AS-A4 TaxID=2933935 RepID=A0ABV0KSU3_9CYAN|nr:putative molybdenum carrier protein [Phormidium sp. FACHB-592]MBD2078265.1 hypothetical protein [Phormidium sp. FACHB-592]
MQTPETAFKDMPEFPERTQRPAATASQWAHYAPVRKAGYECSTQGDRRFSALYAKLSDGRTIEEACQLDVKGYRVQGNDWRLGKGKLLLKPMPIEALHSQYKSLWQRWATENPVLMDTLTTAAEGKVLTDKFARTPISQAQVLAELLFVQQLDAAEVSDQATASPDRITALEPYQVFMFGGNTQGRHGKGAALQAMKFGAEYGNPCGRQGQAYAIVTKDLTKPKEQQLRSVPLNEIEQQISVFLEHAIAHPKHEFLVTRFGCELAGYSETEIGGLWVGKAVPTNVKLPQAFLNIVQAAALEPAIAPKTPTTKGVETVVPKPTTLVVISGGQTGADIGGLKAAHALGLQTGGVAPYGWLVECCARFPNGTNPRLADYGLVEGPCGNSAGHTYILRTELNVKQSDGTLVLGSIDPKQDKGTFRTVELADKHRKPCLHLSTANLFKHPNESVQRIKDWVLDEGVQTLNVAGNRESKCPGLEDRVETVLKVALAEIVRVRSELAMN